MTTYFWDPVAGNNGNDGLSFANRKLDLSAFALAAGDTVRCIASPSATSMGQNATFTNKSLTITLTSAVTTNIDMGEASWTASANVTATTSATRKEGSLSSSLAIAAGFTTGKVAYKATGTLDLSGYQQVSFWVQANAAVAANVFRLRLSTDTTGDTATHEFVINRALNSGQWTVLTFNNAANMNSAIASVALVADSDPGAVTVLLDDIIACKAASSADSLTLNSLISKNTANEPWMAIKSINGTTVTVDAGVQSGAGAGRGYSGVTESATIYKRECLNTASVAGSTTAVHNNTTAGTAASPITISGGWNRTDMSTQNAGDYTFLDGRDGFGYGISPTAAYQQFSKFGFVRYNRGFSSTALNVSIDNCYGVASSNQQFISTNSWFSAGLTDGLWAFGGVSGNVGCIELAGNGARAANLYAFSGSNAYGVFFNGMGFSRLNSIVANNMATYGIAFSTAISTSILNATCRDNGNAGVGANGGTVVSDIHIYNLTTSGNTSRAITQAAISNLNIYNASMTEASKVGAFTANAGSFVTSHKEGGDANANTTYHEFGTIQSDATVIESPANKSWKFSPTSSNLSSSIPFSFRYPLVALVKANKTLTFTARMRRDNTGLTVRLRIKGGIHAGIANDISTEMTAGANTWETVTIQATPTADEWIEIWPEFYGGTTFNGWIGKCTISST